MENIQLEIVLKTRKQKKQVKNTEGLFSTNMQSHCTHPWLAYPSSCSVKISVENSRACMLQCDNKNAREREMEEHAS
jgi:hypothetical protein